MPQMMPMMWTLLFITITMSLLMIMSFLHFFYMCPLSSYGPSKTKLPTPIHLHASFSNLSGKHKSANNWFWKW